MLYYLCNIITSAQLIHLQDDDPLNSGDDDDSLKSDDDDKFETENIIVCQFDKVDYDYILHTYIQLCTYVCSNKCTCRYSPCIRYVYVTFCMGAPEENDVSLKIGVGDISTKISVLMLYVLNTKVLGMYFLFCRIKILTLDSYMNVVVAIKYVNFCSSFCQK